jgi:hypothetical protein
MSQKSDAFRAQVVALVEQFEAALAGSSWSVHRDEKRMRDELGGVYSVPVLTLGKGGTRLVLDPNGYGFPGAEAGVDLYLLPPYDPVAGLYLEQGKRKRSWFIHSPFPPGHGAITRPEEWARRALTADAIRTVLESIAEHAVPSV